MKRYGFKGFPASHGTERKHRAPGSIAARAINAGMGGGLKTGQAAWVGTWATARITAKNHVLVSIDQENNLLVIKGTVPGPSGGYCIVKDGQESWHIEWNAKMIELTVLQHEWAAGGHASGSMSRCWAAASGMLCSSRPS